MKWPVELAKVKVMVSVYLKENGDTYIDVKDLTSTVIKNPRIKAALKDVHKNINELRLRDET